MILLLEAMSCRSVIMGWRLVNLGWLMRVISAVTGGWLLIITGIRGLVTALQAWSVLGA